MSTEIVDFVAEKHLEQIIDILFDVRKSDPAYPPPVDSGFGRDTLAEWLLGEHSLARWVAVDKGRVAGFIHVTNPHRYLTDVAHSPGSEDWGESPLGEIGKFFVSPHSQRTGIGKLLFEEARSFTRASQLTAVLAVVVTSKKAVAFYEKQGMRLVATFQGVHGENLVYADNAGGENVDR
jgi:ribosomal protein S18 acetylase RimI-like enzyme